jgi:hypothetical protein
MTDDQPIPDLDELGFMVPPWVKYPLKPHLGSLAWRMGDGEVYLFAFDAWWRQLSADKRIAWKDKYEVPEKWRPLFTFRDS